MRQQTVPVLIVGGGPVGLGLAVELGWRGVECLLIEQGDGAIIDAKMFATGIRTVEYCRRWGIADEVKNWGFPRDFPFDNVFVTSLVGPEVGRIPVPAPDAAPPFAVSPERFAHCPQFMFDPILAAAARSFTSVSLRYGCRLTGFADDGECVVAELEDVSTGRTEQIGARHMVGCDGFASLVRKGLGIAMGGLEIIDRSLNIMFKTADLGAIHDKGNAGRYVIIGPEGPWASLTPADGTARWRLMVHGHAAIDTSLNPRDLVRRAAGCDFDFEVLGANHWTRRRMVAEHYGRGRVFMAGDAVHVMPPNGGLGMNTGLGDAVDLGWKLAAGAQGWGGPNLLQSYEAERRPVGMRACDEAMKNLARYAGTDLFTDILDDGPAGDHSRAEVGRRLAEGNRLAWENPLNTHLGYRYEGSPICVADGALPPEPEDSRSYVQTSHPGCRAPHVWLADGRSTLDLFGKGFTLLRLGATPPEADGLIEAARRRGVPLDVKRIDQPAVGAAYERALVLVRPDGHVAWRGDAPPFDPGALLDRLRGA